MRTLTAYIARLYLINVLTLFVLLFGFVVTVDVFVNLQRFTDAAVELAQREGERQGDIPPLETALRTTIGIIHLWAPRLLQLYNALVGVVLVTAMGFTCAQLVRHREFVAMLASGISLPRAAAPFLLVGSLFVGVQAVNQEVFVPAVAPLLTRDIGDSGRRGVESFELRLPADADGRLFYAPRFDAETRTIEHLRVWERSDAGAVTRTITADRAEWDGSRWALTGGIARPIDPTGPPTPIDTLDSSLDPTGLMVRHLEGFGQNLSWGQISRILEFGGLDEFREDALDRVRWGRAASLASNLLTLAAALPFFLVRLPGSLLLASLRAAPIAAAGLVAAAAAPVLELPGLPPAVGAFVPAGLLLPLAIALISTMKT